MKRSIPREQQIEIWQKACEMFAGGLGANYKQIAQALDVHENTVRKYVKLDEPPGPMNPKGSHRYVTRWTPNELSGGFRDSVPPKIADLRDRIVSAFLSGDLEEHGRLTVELKRSLAEYRAVLKKLRLARPEPVEPLFTEAAE
jgi:hypothetical protein